MECGAYLMKSASSGLEALIGGVAGVFLLPPVKAYAVPNNVPRTPIASCSTGKSATAGQWVARRELSELNGDWESAQSELRATDVMGPNLGAENVVLLDHCGGRPGQAWPCVLGVLFGAIGGREVCRGEGENVAAVELRFPIPEFLPVDGRQPSRNRLGKQRPLHSSSKVQPGPGSLIAKLWGTKSS